MQRPGTGWDELREDAGLVDDPSAKARNQLGMVEVGTKALLAKVSGKTTGKVAAFTV